MPTQRSSGGSSSRTVAGTSTRDSSSSSSGADRTRSRAHKRSRSGCFTCRLRRKKCDESHPACNACTNLNLRCEYKRPIWWVSTDARKLQKERIKNKIKNTKSLERHSARAGNVRDRVLASPDSDSDLTRRFAQPITDNFENFGPHYANPGWVPITYGSCGPYEVDVRTERQTFVNDVPLRHDSSVSTFSAMGPPQLNATLPTFPAEEWLQGELLNPAQGQVPADPAMAQQSVDQSSSSLTASIPVSDYDRPLLDHFVENVLRMIFPILEVHQRGSARALAILQSLETNKSYLHCCLSVAAIHLKSTSGLDGEQIDHDILRHRYDAISELCQALNKDSDHEHILDATLAMIFFHCAVGSPDDYLPDIPWHDHFQAVSNLVSKLDLPNTLLPCGNGYLAPPFSMSLTSWIDILGATMLGKTPQFAHSYRTKHLGGTSSGLQELMGCDDRVMYLISEIACLESLKIENRIDDMTICNHVSSLGKQLEHTESVYSTPENPYSRTGAIRPEILTKNMTSIFRSAARIYLCSLVPGSDKYQSSIQNLVTGIADAMALIPAGAFGYDRSLVWPLLIAGAFSTPSSTFRQVLHDRVVAMGGHSQLGSFGRMYRLLNEYWRLNDEPTDPSLSAQNRLPDFVYDNTNMNPNVYVSPPVQSTGMRVIKRQQVHWREIMDRNNWRYLLI